MLKNKSYYLPAVLEEASDQCEDECHQGGHFIAVPHEPKLRSLVSSCCSPLHSALTNFCCRSSALLRNFLFLFAVVFAALLVRGRGFRGLWTCRVLIGYRRHASQSPQSISIMAVRSLLRLRFARFRSNNVTTKCTSVHLNKATQLDRLRACG